MSDEINTIEEFQAACELHDLTHAYSDDGSAYASGSNDFARIKKAAEKFPREAVEQAWNAAVDRKLVERARANFYWRWPAVEGEAR